MAWKSKLKSEKIYIIPTRTGLIFITATWVILFIGSGYSNNLVNILAFFMLSLVFVSMVLTNIPLKNIQLESVEFLPVFAGEAFSAQLVFRNIKETDVYGVKIETAKESELFSVKAGQAARIEVEFKPEKRGLRTLPRLEMSSVYPLGLFHAWKMVSLEKKCLVYPARNGELDFPQQVQTGWVSDLQPDIEMNQKIGGDDFRGHRAYIAGDSARHIDWKAHARGRPLLVKELDEGAPADLVFDWQALGSLDTESRLSQLATWIDLAYERDFSFQLYLPDARFLSVQGNVQVHQCLAILAAYPERDR